MARRRKTSDYGKQLREKQELKKIYGLREKQFRHYIDMAKKEAGNPADSLLILLERRLDNAIYRCGFAKTRPQARQFASHGLFLLNGKRVYTPSILLKPGDNIRPRKKEQFEGDYKPSVSWLDLDRALTGTITSLPVIDEIRPPLNINTVMEFYSR